MAKKSKATEILDCVLPRIMQPSSTDEAQMGLEVTVGPYKGVTFGYDSFEVLEDKAEDGMVPVRYSTIIYSAPNAFVKDESFDAFTSEVLIAWLTLVSEQGDRSDATFRTNATPTAL